VFNLKRYAEANNAARLPEFLPWASLIDRGVVLQKVGAFQKTICFRGPDLTTAPPDELDLAAARLNNALTRLPSGWALFCESQRFRTGDYPGSAWPSPAACLIDVERKQAFAEGDYFESEYYLTLVYLPPREAVGRVMGAFLTQPPSAAGGAPHFDRELAFFKRTVTEIADLMRAVFPFCEELDDDDTLTYLHNTVSTTRHSVRTPQTPFYLDALLPDEPFYAGDVPMLGDSYLATTTITGFPGETLAGILEALNALPLQYRWTSRYICMGPEEAKAELESYRRRWFAKRKSLLALIGESFTKQDTPLVDNAAAEKAGDADAALRELGEGMVSYGFLTVSVTLWDRDRTTLRRQLQEVKKVIQHQGFICRDETFNARDAWLGTLPGHTAANLRRPLVNSLNLAHLLPLSAIWSGEAQSRHLRSITGIGTPHIQCSTEASTPFRLSLDVGDVGHTFVVGPTGSGKSTLLSFLAAQWPKYPGARVRIFDKDRSARATTMALGGTVYQPGVDAFTFQPLAGVDVPAERAWALSWLIELLSLQQVTETPDLKAELSSALQLLANHPPEQRTLSTLAAFLTFPATRSALSPYTCSGQYGRIFDANVDSAPERGAFWEMFEMGHLLELGKDACAPALSYLFHRLERSFDGAPTLLILDEVWRMLDHPVFAKKIREWLKTLRKVNVYVLFATQELADALASPITHTILSQTPTKIFLADPSAAARETADIYRHFGLSDAEIALLAAGTKKRDYYFRSEKGRRPFRLDLGPVALSFVGMSSPADQLFLDSVAHLRSQEVAECILRHRGLEWAADAIRSARLNPRPCYSSAGG